MAHVFRRTQALKVFQAVVRLVTIDVVDVAPGWDGTIVVFPDDSVHELAAVKVEVRLVVSPWFAVVANAAELKDRVFGAWHVSPPIANNTSL
jgi:hypothetical protein